MKVSRSSAYSARQLNGYLNARCAARNGQAECTRGSHAAARSDHRGVRPRGAAVEGHVHVRSEVADDPEGVGPRYVEHAVHGRATNVDQGRVRGVATGRDSKFVAGRGVEIPRIRGSLAAVGALPREL